MCWRGQQPLAVALASILILFSLSARAISPIPADTESLLDGAQSYELYCTECHGWEPSQQFMQLYNTDDDDSLAELVAELEEARVAAERPAEDDWPEWAAPPGSMAIDGFSEPPRPTDRELAEDEELRTAVLDDLYSAIDEYYASAGEAEEFVPDEEIYDDADAASTDPFAGQETGETGRIPGATDLTDPAAYFHGIDEVALFDNIAHGTGPTMPAFLDVLGSEEAVWNLVNYIRSLWGEEWLD